MCLPTERSPDSKPNMKKSFEYRGSGRFMEFNFLHTLQIIGFNVQFLLVEKQPAHELVLTVIAMEFWLGTTFFTPRLKFDSYLERVV